MTKSLFLTKYPEKDGHFYETENDIENPIIESIDIDSEIFDKLQPYFNDEISIFNEDNEEEYKIFTPSIADRSKALEKLLDLFCKMIEETAPLTKGVLDSKRLLEANNKLRRLTTVVCLLEMKDTVYFDNKNYILNIG